MWEVRVIELGGEGASVGRRGGRVWFRKSFPAVYFSLRLGKEWSMDQ